ncbi:unnamed protein product, partial [Amoebophrya sp. A120]|eukprot:GSA120T00025168001.1
MSGAPLSTGSTPTTTGHYILPAYYRQCGKRDSPYCEPPKLPSIALKDENLDNMHTHTNLQLLATGEYIGAEFTQDFQLFCPLRKTIRQLFKELRDDIFPNMFKCIPREPKCGAAIFDRHEICVKLMLLLLNGRCRRVEQRELLMREMQRLAMVNNEVADRKLYDYCSAIKQIRALVLGGGGSGYPSGSTTMNKDGAKSGGDNGEAVMHVVDDAHADPVEEMGLVAENEMFEEVQSCAYDDDFCDKCLNGDIQEWPRAVYHEMTMPEGPSPEERGRPVETHVDDDIQYFADLDDEGKLRSLVTRLLFLTPPTEHWPEENEDGDATPVIHGKRKKMTVLTEDLGSPDLRAMIAAGEKSRAAAAAAVKEGAVGNTGTTGAAPPVVPSPKTSSSSTAKPRRPYHEREFAQPTYFSQPFKRPGPGLPIGTAPGQSVISNMVDQLNRINSLVLENAKRLSGKWTLHKLHPASPAAVVAEKCKQDAGQLAEIMDDFEYSLENYFVDVRLEDNRYFRNRFLRFAYVLEKQEKQLETLAKGAKRIQDCMLEEVAGIYEKNVRRLYCKK